METPLAPLLAEVVKDICDAEAASILVLENDGALRFQWVSGGAEELITSIRLEPKEGVAGEVLETGKIAVLGQEECREKCSKRILNLTEVIPRSLLVAPLFTRDDKIVGVVQALNCLASPSFSDVHVDRLQRISPPLAEALFSITQFSQQPNLALSQFYRAFSNTLNIRARIYQESVDKSTYKEQMVEESVAFADHHMMALARFASGVAHEMNNPLSYIKSNVRVLLEYINDLRDVTQNIVSVFDENNQLRKNATTKVIKNILDKINDPETQYSLSDLRELTQDTEKGLDRIHDIIQRLLLFSDFQVHKQESVNLSLQINNAMDFVLPNHRVQSATFDIENNIIDIPEVLGNKNKVYQVLIEVIDNAVSAAIKNKTGARPTIRVGNYCTDSHSFITVEDNGPGIKTHNSHQVFEPFFTDKTNWDGLGLGLSTVYSMMMSMKGRVSFDTWPERGTLVTLAFLRADHAKNDDTKESADLSDKLSGKSGRYYEDLQ